MLRMSVACGASAKHTIKTLPH